MKKYSPTDASFGVAVNWEYLIVALPELHAAALHKGESAAVVALNREGELGWEAVGITPLAGGGFAVLMKRPLR